MDAVMQGAPRYILQGEDTLRTQDWLEVSGNPPSFSQVILHLDPKQARLAHERGESGQLWVQLRYPHETGRSPQVWHRRHLTWEVPVTFTPGALARLLRRGEFDALLDSVIDGWEERWNGHAYIGHLQAEAEQAMGQLQEALYAAGREPQNSFVDDPDAFGIVWASDWFATVDPVAWLGLEPGMRDEDLERAIALAEHVALYEGNVYLHGLRPYVEGLVATLTPETETGEASEP